DGFFAMQAADGPMLYTREGSFAMDGAGYINDGLGNRLQVFPTDATGTVTSTTPVDALIPPMNGTAEFAGISISDDGQAIATYADGSQLYVGTVALARFVAPTGLKQVGSSNWEATGISGPAAYGQPNQGAFGSLLSGAVELSNVDIAEELAGLFTAQRNFQANAKAI